MIVDDEPDSLDVVRRALAYHGAHVTIASGGKQGWALIRKDIPQLVLTDLSMPGFDGWQLLFQMREDEVTAQIPVIAITAHAMNGDKERTTKAGFNGYITKPLSPIKLADDIVDILGLKNPTPESKLTAGGQ